MTRDEMIRNESESNYPIASDDNSQIQQLRRWAYIAGANRDTTDPECIAATGHKNNDVRIGYEQGYEAHEAVMMDFIAKWDGSTNSPFGKAMSEAMERNRNGWIRVEDGLPPHMDTVMLFCEHGEYVGYFDAADLVFRTKVQTKDDPNWWETEYKISHWQPLPTPPQH